jgi:DNA-binding FrmR family transcriptional regulator
MTNTATKRNQRIAARLRRIQGQIAAIERSLIADPDGAILLQRVAASSMRDASLFCGHNCNHFSCY